MTEKYKLSEQEEEIIKYFRQRAEQNANSLIDSNGLEFIEENRDGAYRLTALVHFASFDMRVYYYPILFPETEYLNYIDFSLKFSASEYKFSIYDIFNYFDIEDFNLYYYNRCSIKSSVDSAVDHIFAVCQNYMSDIEYIAKRSDAVIKLEKQCDADEYITDDFESADYTADNEDMIDDFDSITLLRPVCYRGKTQSIIKKLRKNEEEDLNSLYEQRLLKYLEAGNAVPLNAADGNKKSNKKYLKAEMMSYAVILLISYGLAYAAAILIQKFIFGDAYVPNDEFREIKILGLFPEQFIKAMFAGLLFFIAALFSLGGKIVALFAPHEDKKSFSLKYISEGIGIKNKKKAKSVGTVLMILLMIAGVLVLLLPVSFL